MDSLPIYYTLANLINEDTLTLHDKKNLIHDIQINIDTHEIVFAIIKYYQIKNSNNGCGMPYACKYLKTKDGYKFDIDMIPVKLVKMLIEFFLIHNRSKTK
jgi:hypothetical protein